MKDHPKFITVEGVDGAGKGTQIETIANYLRSRGFAVVLTREPGGTALGDELREIILNKQSIQLDVHAETMLLFSARRQHLSEIIEPALNAGAFVICDRFTDSSWAYQHGGKGVEAEFLTQLELLTHKNLNPALTFLFDLPASVSMQRIAFKEPDKFESLGEAFFNNVRNTYLKRAEQRKAMRIVDSTQSIEHVGASVEKILEEHLKEHNLLQSCTKSFKRGR